MSGSLVDNLEGFRVVPPGCQESHGLPLNPFRTRIWNDGTGWCARYRKGSTGWEVRGCESAADASVTLRHFVRMKVAQIDGEFVEVVPR